MSIEVTCIQCGSSHYVNDRLAGRRVRCPSCDSAVHVPENAVMKSVESDTTIIEEKTVLVETESDEVKSEPIAAVSVSNAVDSLVSKTSVPAGTMVDSVDEDDEEVVLRKKRPEEEMDMTPMVDVTFLLLIFFMVTAAFSLQKSIEMPRQQTDAPSTSVVEEETEDLDMVEVQVDEFGAFLVMAPDWERETPGKQNLITALKDAISGNTDGMRLVVTVHELAKLHALVDAMDAGTIAGYAELEVTQVEEFD